MTGVKETLRTTPGKLGILIFLALLLCFTMLLSLRVGTLKLSFAELFELLRTQERGIPYEIIFNIRMPRIILGALVGGCFAVSGAILQSVMRNPLASPGIIGISAGGGLAGIILLLALPQWNAFLVPAAFAGSLLTALLVYLLAWKQGASPVRLILAGVAVSAMLGAFSNAVLLFHAEEAGSILNFTIGSLAGRSWTHIGDVGIYMLAGLGGAFLFSGKLNILALGDEVATGLGLRVEQMRFLMIGIAALLAAASVSVAGLLGFVGLIAPHSVRMIIGPDNRYLLPGSALFGAFMVTGCDTVGRILMDPAELPAGIIMALLGPPFFLYLLRSHRYEA